MFSQTEKQELKELFGDAVIFDEPMASYTNINIGGPADVVCYPQDASGLEKILQWCEQKKCPYFVLGKGSNTLIRDGGVRGVVVSLSQGFKDFSLSRENGHFVWVQAGAGCPTQQVVRWTASQGYAGMERLAGIPGTVGGNVVMNAGTFYGEIKDILESIDVLDSSKKVRTILAEKISFEYRKALLPPKCIVLGALFKLEKMPAEEVEKKIKDLFEKRGSAQPIHQPNLGSIFKNPPKQKAKTLIEEAGLSGVRVGRARVSEKHGNWIVNEGGATAKDVLVLIGLIKDRVNESSGVLLETEIKVIGEEK